MGNGNLNEETSDNPPGISLDVPSNIKDHTENTHEEENPSNPADIPTWCSHLKTADIDSEKWEIPKPWSPQPLTPTREGDFKIPQAIGDFSSIYSSPQKNWTPPKLPACAHSTPATLPVKSLRQSLLGTEAPPVTKSGTFATPSPRNASDTSGYSSNSSGFLGFSPPSLSLVDSLDDEAIDLLPLGSPGGGDLDIFGILNFEPSPPKRRSLGGIGVGGGGSDDDSTPRASQEQADQRRDTLDEDVIYEGTSYLQKSSLGQVQYISGLHSSLTHKSLPDNFQRQTFAKDDTTHKNESATTCNDQTEDKSRFQSKDQLRAINDTGHIGNTHIKVHDSKNNSNDCSGGKSDFNIGNLNQNSHINSSTNYPNNVSNRNANSIIRKYLEGHYIPDNAIRSNGRNCRVANNGNPRKRLSDSNNEQIRGSNGIVNDLGKNTQSYSKDSNCTNGNSVIFKILNGNIDNSIAYGNISSNTPKSNSTSGGFGDIESNTINKSFDAYGSGNDINPRTNYKSDCNKISSHNTSLKETNSIPNFDATDEDSNLTDDFQTEIKETNQEFLSPDEKKTQDTNNQSYHAKPKDPYIALISKILLEDPEKKLILADIYEILQEKYPYFKTAETSWRNVVRHNLSINECFIKAGRASNGRGFYWSIHPACLEMFKSGDFRRREAKKLVQQSKENKPNPCDQTYLSKAVQNGSGPLHGVHTNNSQYSAYSNTHFTYTYPGMHHAAMNTGTVYEQNQLPNNNRFNMADIHNRGQMYSTYLGGSSSYNFYSRSAPS